MRNNIDSYFKNKLDEPQSPPAGAWENIQAHRPEKEKKRLLPFWGMMLGIASVALLVSGGGYLLYNANSTPSNPISNSIAIPTIQKGNNTTNGFTQDESTLPSANPNSMDVISSEILSESSPAYANHVFIANSIHSNNNKTFKDTHATISNPSNSPRIAQSDLNENKENPLNQSVYKNNSIDLEIQKWNPELSFFVLNLENTTVKEAHIAAIEKPKESKSHVKMNKKIDFDRFHVSAFASPMALNTFVGSSMLSDEMRDYKTENNITLAYGMKGAYAISPNVKIRTGISKVGFEQVTKNVPLTVSFPSGPIASNLAAQNNINYKSNVRIASSNLQGLSGDELGKPTLGNIQQQSEYIEIPLEAEIAILQTSSIGISATGGGSTWLLSRNKIYVHTEDYTEELGQANNLNKTSFSANAGLKFDMKIMDKVQLNVEPNFKYLINPVNNIEKYNPYTVGVNAGISISLK